MKKYLVIGNPIEHSLSPQIHNYWIQKYNITDSVYEKKKIEEKDLKNIVNEMREGKVNGVNVTVPFKRSIIPYLDELEPTARKTGSVNTLIKKGNKIIGYNTDEPGFGLTLEEIFIKNNLTIKNIFILGAGGVTSSIICAFKKFRTKIFLTNRTKEKATDLKEQYPEIDILDWGTIPKSFDLAINTTSVGLKNNEKIDLNFDQCNGNKEKIFYDLIYNPKETNFLKEARLRGNIVLNGHKMFLNQAMLAFNLWTNIKPEIDSNVIGLVNK